jgi:chromosome partitioning protein
MGSVIVAASSKGGCAKSVTSIALATNLARQGYRVACVDADPNAALMTWHRTANRTDISVSAEIDEDAIVAHIYERAATHDVVVVDTGGWMNQTGVFSFGAANVVLIPVMPDRNSVLEARRTARKVESVAQIARREIPYRVVLSRWTPKGLLERATLADLEAAKLPYLRQYVPNLTAFAKSSFTGQMPHTGYIGLVLGKVINELVEMDVIGAKPAKVAA